MVQSLRALMGEMPDKADRIVRLAKENARFVKLANTHHALCREIERFERAGDKSRMNEVEHLRKMRRIVRNKIDMFLMG